MIPFGILTYAYNLDNQGTGVNQSTTRQMENSSMLLATTFDADNPLYARDGIIQKIAKIIKRHKK